MHVITRKRLNEYVQYQDPTAKSGLDRWYRLMKQSNFHSPNEMLQTFSSHKVDQVNNFTVFDIGGNTAPRIIAVIHYNRKKVYIRHVLTHAEYDKGKWKK
ncbi:hypothetical protein C6497_05405 [Candidatus Poribacteria bacterium]|nr:MAG: hypothetical protein C6497_05405 [Candidatus Poribacteria bacterium]